MGASILPRSYSTDDDGLLIKSSSSSMLQNSDSAYIPHHGSSWKHLLGIIVMYIMTTTEEVSVPRFFKGVDGQYLLRSHRAFFASQGCFSIFVRKAK